MDNEKFTKREMQEYAMLAIDSNDGVPMFINNTKTEISDSKYYQAIREIPDYCGLPYFATIDNIKGYHMLTVLCVSPYREDEQYNLQHSIKDIYLANAYVVNLDEPSLSESGTVTIEVDRQNRTLRRIY